MLHPEHDLVSSSGFSPSAVSMVPHPSKAWLSAHGGWTDGWVLFRAVQCCLQNFQCILAVCFLSATFAVWLWNWISSCFTTENAIQAFGNGSDVTVWQPALPVQTTTATSTTAFRPKTKPLGPAGSENEIPTHVLPPCANLQVRASWDFVRPSSQ